MNNAASINNAPAPTAMSRMKRADFVRFTMITTRWMDNDSYGHINNVVYYSYFDTAVNKILIESGVLDIRESACIGYVVETGCRYFAPVSFPDDIQAGVRVAHLGTSSVRYEIGLFRKEEDLATACGHFVHVYVDRATRKPVPIPEETRAVLRPLAAAAPSVPTRSGGVGPTV